MLAHRQSKESVRLNTLRTCGWQYLIIWGHELKEENWEQKLLNKMKIEGFVK